MQIQDHREIQPSFAGPHIADIARPFLVGRIRVEVPGQQVWRDVERVLAIGRHLVFLAAFDADTVLAHQSANTAVANAQTKLFQFFCHARATIAAQAEPKLFFDVSKNNHVGPLPLTGRPTAIGAQAPTTDAQHPTHSLSAEGVTVFFDEPEPHGFWLAKKAVAFLRNSHVGL